MMLWSGEDMAVLNFPLDEGGGGGGGGGNSFISISQAFARSPFITFFSQSWELLAPKDQPYKFNKLI